MIVLNVNVDHKILITQQLIKQVEVQYT